MVEFKRSQVSLFLMAALQFAGANGLRSILIRNGHDVTLPCVNMINDQNRCDRTVWNFSGSRSETVELIRLGQIRENVGEKSDRLSVTESCSLAIKKVTDEDAGFYVCQQFNKTGRKLVSDSVVRLSVVSLTEQKNNDEVTLSCFVSTFGQCEHTVKWLYRSQVVDRDSKELRTSESLCSASLHFKTSHYIYTSRFYPLKCEVTNEDTVQLFSFIAGPSGEKAGAEQTPRATPRATPTTGTTTTPPASQPSNIVDSTRLNASTGCSAVNYVMLVLRVVELLLITLMTVLLFRASGNQKPSDDQTVRNDEDEGVVNYENFGESSASVVLH